LSGNTICLEGIESLSLWWGRQLRSETKWITSGLEASGQTCGEMPAETQSRPEYDVPTALTFLMAGLALGWFLTLLFSPPVDKSKTARLAVSKPSLVSEAVD